MFKRVLWSVVLGLLLISLGGYAQSFVWKDPQTVYTWDDQYLFQYAQKLSELNEDQLRNSKRMQALQNVIDELGRRGPRLSKNSGWYRGAMAASGKLYSKIAGDPSLSINLGTQFHDSMDRIMFNVKNDTTLNAADKQPLVDYYNGYGKGSGRRSHEVLETAKTLSSLGDRLGAAQMLERYGDHHEIPTGHEGERVMQAIRGDPKLFEAATLAIVTGEKVGKASPLKYNLFEYTRNASSQDKERLASLWQKALLTTKDPSNQYQWADFLVQQGDPKSLETVFKTQFLEPERARLLQKDVLAKMDVGTLTALAGQDPYIKMRDDGRGIAAAPVGEVHDALTANQFQTLAEQLLAKGAKWAARMAAQKSLQASPEATGIYSNNASLGILIDLAHAGDSVARSMLDESFLDFKKENPKTTMTDRDRVFMLQEMTRTHNSQFLSLFRAGLENLSAEVSEAGLQGFESILGHKGAYREALMGRTFNPELRKRVLDRLIEERKTVNDPETLNAFDKIYTPAIKTILHDPSSDSLRVKVLNYFKEQEDRSIVEDLNVAAQTMVQDVQERGRALSCEKDSFSYQLPSALIELSSSSDEQSAMSLVSLFKEGVKTSCPSGDLTEWLSDIEKGFKHFDESVQAKIVARLEAAIKVALSSSVQERLTLALNNLKPKPAATEEAGASCPPKEGTAEAAETLADTIKPIDNQLIINGNVEKLKGKDYLKYVQYSSPAQTHPRYIQSMTVYINGETGELQSREEAEAHFDSVSTIMFDYDTEDPRNPIKQISFRGGVETKAYNNLIQSIKKWQSSNPARREKI